MGLNNVFKKLQWAEKAKRVRLPFEMFRQRNREAILPASATTRPAAQTGSLPKGTPGAPQHYRFSPSRSLLRQSTERDDSAA